MIIIRLSLLSINSSAPSTTYMRQWTKSALVQVMACHRFGANPLPEQCWLVANWILRNEFQWNMNPHAKLFIHENAFQNVVCEMAAILSRGDELRTDTKTKAKQGKALVEIFGWPDKGLFFFRNIHTWVVPLSVFYGIILVVIGLVATICQEMRQLHVGGMSSGFVAVSWQTIKTSKILILGYLWGRQSGPE